MDENGTTVDTADQTVDTGSQEQTNPDGAGVEQQPGGDGGRQQPGMVTLTQAQIDEMIGRAFARGAAKGERTAAGAVQPGGQDAGSEDVPASGPDSGAGDVLAQLAEARAQNVAMQRRLDALAKNIPADRDRKSVV